MSTLDVLGIIDVDRKAGQLDSWTAGQLDSWTSGTSWMRDVIHGTNHANNSVDDPSNPTTDVFGWRSYL
nr:hypothetical protein [Bacillus cereus]